MATLVAPQGEAPARHYRRVPWSRHAWSQEFYLTAGIPAQLLGLFIPLFLVHWNGRWGFGLWPYWPAWLAGLPVVFLLIPMLTVMHRNRLRATAGVEIPRQPAGPSWLTVKGITAAVRSQATWRQFAYHLVVGPALALAAMAAFALWFVGAAFALVYFYGWTLPQGSLLRQSTFPDSSGLGTHIAVTIAGAAIPAGTALTVLGIGMLLVAPRFTDSVASLDATAARALLGPSRAEELEHRVEHLTQTRAGVVDAADAERRRLERDLHDGTQQRLVSLAMNLGMARAQATTTGATHEEARQAIAEAHEEAKAALAELRDLIRGLHPAVLEDRGLDAALSGVVARMPIPVRLTVDLTRRPAPSIEAVAYFVVSEGLANIAKHAQASQAEVFVQRSGDRLHIIITDDGVGGADPARGTGLAGLARRAQSVDGTFEVSSPPGGPTMLTVDLPCVR